MSRPDWKPALLQPPTWSTTSSPEGESLLSRRAGGALSPKVGTGFHLTQTQYVE